MRKTRLMPRLLRGSGRSLVVIKVLLSLVIIVFAVSINSAQKSFTAELGSAATVPNNLLLTDRGFTIATLPAVASGTTCAAPIIFGPAAGTGNNAITSGHLVYTVRVNSTSNPPALTKYNVTFTLGATVFGPVCIETSAVPAGGQIIDCKFDIATTTLPVSIYTFKVTIQ